MNAEDLHKAVFGNARLVVEDESLQLTEVEPCKAFIWHGPGHQSRTYCTAIGPHEIHRALYGSQFRLAEWRGPEAMTGFFDEPPEMEEE